jgi:hypothetical protein
MMALIVHVVSACSPPPSPASTLRPNGSNGPAATRHDLADSNSEHLARNDALVS